MKIMYSTIISFFIILGCAHDTSTYIKATVKKNGRPDIVRESSGDLIRHQTYSQFIRPDYKWGHHDKLVFYYIKDGFYVDIINEYRGSIDREEMLDLKEKARALKG